MSDHKTNQAMLPPDPSGLNRALDRAAAEHLREVAPGLAPSAPAPPQPEPAICRHCAAGGCAPAPPAAATGPHKAERLAARLRMKAVPTNFGDFLREVADYLETIPGMERQLASAKAMFGVQATEDAGMSLAECIAHERRMLEEKTAQHAAVIAAAPPAPEAAGEMSREAFESYPQLLVQMAYRYVPVDARDEFLAAVDVIRRHDAALRTRAREAERERDEARREGHVNELRAKSAEALLAAANARAEEAERRALMAGQDKVAAQRRADSSHRLMENERAARLKAEKEMNLLIGRDVPRLEERLAAAEAEVKRRDEYPHPCLICFGVRPASGKPCACNGTNNVYTAFDYLNAEAARLRLVYDDSSLDATDGAHPAWWRGSDAGVAGAVRIVNEALDGPLPLVGCVGGADLESVRQRVAALRARAQRLVEAGDAMASGNLGLADMRARWAAAKGAKP